MKLQTELISVAAAKNRIETNVTENPISEELKQESGFNSLNDLNKIRSSYEDVQNIDQMLNQGRIQNIEGAMAKRKTYLNRTINFMVRFRYINREILQTENITEVEFYQKYNYHMRSMEFITETIFYHPFIQEKIIELAELEEPIKRQYDLDIANVNSEINNLGLRPAKSLLNISTYFTDIAILNDKKDKIRTDYLEGGYSYRIETICYKLIYTKWYKEYNKLSEPFDLDTMMENIWELSPTSQIALIRLLVKEYKSYFAQEILEYREDKKRLRKSEWHKKKRIKNLTAKEKHELVIWGKEEGLTQKEVATQLNVSVSTVQKYWKKVIPNT